MKTWTALLLLAACSTPAAGIRRQEAAHLESCLKSNPGDWYRQACLNESTARCVGKHLERDCGSALLWTSNH